MADSSTAKPKLVRLGDLLEEGLAEATARHEAYTTGSPLGPKVTLSDKLGRELCGALPVGLTVLHGPPGSAKTALANQLAAEAGCPALVVTCEMSPLELLRRHAARITRTYLSKFRTGQLPPSEWLALMRRTAAASPQLHMLDGTKAPVLFGYLREVAETVKGTAPHFLVVVDSAHSWVRGSGSLEAASEYEATSEALRALQQLTAELSCAVLVVAEQNRASRGSERQEASAGTRVFEYAAEVVIALSRDPDAAPDVNGEIPITATLAKNRLGTAGTRVDFAFNGGFMAFREADAVAIGTRRKSA
jgi:replicative DNA helicase